MDAASLPDFIGHILISFLMKPCDVRNVLSGIPLLIRIISFNVSLPVCWEVELIILRVRCVTAHWRNLSRSIRGCPSSLGTRSHELALFVVLSAPFASLCDSPDEYRKYPDILKYLAEVPTSWDQTIPLAARVGEYAVLAKQKGNTWYIGGLNAWGERTIQVDCSFLPQDKKYTIEIFQDKKRSNKNANLYEHKIMDIDNKNIIEMFMASGGGFVIVIREKK